MLEPLLGLLEPLLTLLEPLMAILEPLLALLKPLLALLTCLILLPALVPDSSPYRHSVCLLSLISLMTVLGTFCFPVFIWRPCDTRNFRLVWYVMYAYSRVLGLYYQFSNTQVLHSLHNYIIIANHQSYFDAIGVPLIAGWAERLAVISTNGVKYLGPMGLSAKLAGFIFVRRFKAGAGYPNLKKQVQQHFSSKQPGCILIFPEGGIGPGVDLLKFKSGPFRLAAELGVPLLPLVLSEYPISPDNTVFTRGKVLAEFMQPIYVNEENIELLKVETRDLMQTKFDELNQRVKAETQK